MAENVVLEIQFLVYPRDFFTREILLAPETIMALNNAAKILSLNSRDRYKLVLTRGYIYWGKWRWFRGQLARFIFHILYWHDRKDAESLFGHNGHNDGCSVDVVLYDVSLSKKIRWLSWKNIIISRTQAEKMIEMNKKTLNMLDVAMTNANFIGHSDPREKLQVHYRLIMPGQNTSLLPIPKNMHSVS